MSLNIQLRVDGEVVWEYNITHNLVNMAKELMVYDCIWHPDIVFIYRASDLLPFLEEALLILLKDEDRFRKFEPSNGWGKYEHLVEFLTQYIRACAKFKNAVVEVS